jgi:hypothetical protein
LKIFLFAAGGVVDTGGELSKKLVLARGKMINGKNLKRKAFVSLHAYFN